MNTLFGPFIHLAAAIVTSTLLAVPTTLTQVDQSVTPSAVTWSCDTVGTQQPSTPEIESKEHDEMSMDVEFDQLYIDMMLPHHGSIIALAEAASPRLTDPRLTEMARNIITTQSSEQTELMEYRVAWYGSAVPDTSDHGMMTMLEAMPVGTMGVMMPEMDAATQVTEFCAASDADLSFIEQTIPHHQMAIDTSVIALEKAVHPETKAFAQKVIADQQAEINLLHEIMSERTGESTPAG